jgi:hypothetical protein
LISVFLPHGSVTSRREYNKNEDFQLLKVKTIYIAKIWKDLEAPDLGIPVTKHLKLYWEFISGCCFIHCTSQCRKTSKIHI